MKAQRMSTPILFGLCVGVLALGGFAEGLAPHYYWLMMVPLMIGYVVIVKELGGRRND